MSFDIASLSRTGSRPENEDYTDFLQTPSASCWVLADGLGGHRGGAEAARAVVEAALASFREMSDATEEAVRRHITQAQTSLTALQAANPSLANMRSTIVVLVSTPRSSVWGHVGDSRLYHLRAGQVIARTRDHSVSQALVDVGQIDARGQGAHEDRSRLLRCLGKDDADAGAAVSGPHALARGDAFLLCTDGFWEALDTVAIEIDYAGADDATAWIERMEARLRRSERPLSDNYTATAIRLIASDGLPEAPPHNPHRGAKPVSRDANIDRDAPGARAHAVAQRSARGVAALVLLAVIASATAAGIWRREAIGAWMQRVWARVMSTTSPVTTPATASPSTSPLTSPAKTAAPPAPSSTPPSSTPPSSTPLSPTPPTDIVQPLDMPGGSGPRANPPAREPDSPPAPEHEPPTAKSEASGKKSRNASKQPREGAKKPGGAGKGPSA